MRFVVKYIIAVKNVDTDELYGQERATSDNIADVLDNAVLVFGTNIHFNIRVDGIEKG